MDNKIIKMQVEILDLNKIEQYKEMLKKDSISYYEDFLLDNIVFIEVENKIKTEIEKDSRFEVHMGHIAYHLKSIQAIKIGLKWQDIASGADMIRTIRRK